MGADFLPPTEASGQKPVGDDSPTDVWSWRSFTTGKNKPRFACRCLVQT